MEPRQSVTEDHETPMVTLFSCLCFGLFFAFLVDGVFKAVDANFVHLVVGWLCGKLLCCGEG